MNYPNILIQFASKFAVLALLGGATIAGAATPDGSKLMIGVAPPQVHLEQGVDAAEPLRQAVMNRLRSPTVEPVALAGNTPTEIEADAKAKGCSQVLYTQVERKHGIGGLLGKLAPLAGVLTGLAGAGGGGGGAGLTGVVAQTAASAAASSAATAAEKQMMQVQHQMMAEQPSQGSPAQALQAATAGSIKHGDNISFGYRLAPVGGGAPLKSETLHAKADADGQDILSTLVEQLAQGVSPAPQSTASAQLTTGGAASVGGAGGMASPSTTQAEHTGFLHGLFSARDKNAAKAIPTAAPSSPGAMPDCAQMASMPNAPISFDVCQKMARAQQTYDQAAADPSAARPGDEQMSCAQIKAELRTQQLSAPDKVKVAETTAAVTNEQALLHKHMAEANAVMAQEQVKVDAAVAADRATEMATGGLVRTNATSAAAMAAQARVTEVGMRQAAERRPTEQKMYSGVADLGVDAAQQLANNPRLARLVQLAQARGCKGS